MGHRVLIGANGRSRDLLQLEFPDLTYVPLPDYDVRYPASGAMSLMMLVQLPRLIRTVFAEKAALNHLIQEHKIDAVISDNRFGLGSRKIVSVYMTHQIAIQAPERLKWVEPLLYFLHKLVMRSYHQIWIPDYKEEPYLSGDLSHSKELPNNAIFIGPLSRFSLSSESATKVDNFGLPDKIDILVLLSGPEPQRSIFEKIIFEQLKGRDEQILILRGTPDDDAGYRLSESVNVVNHLPAQLLESVFKKATVIIARAGYSTIMDLATTGKKAILIPTPGQTEQEYLAESLMQKRLFYSETQDNFSIERSLGEVNNYAGVFPDLNNEDKLRDVIEDLFLQK